MVKCFPENNKCWYVSCEGIDFNTRAKANGSKATRKTKQANTFEVSLSSFEIREKKKLSKKLQIQIDEE